MNSFTGVFRTFAFPGLRVGPSRLDLSYSRVAGEPTRG